MIFLYCSKCGKENSDNVNFCIYCGEKLVATQNSEETTVLKHDFYSNDTNTYVPLSGGNQNNFYTNQQYDLPKKNTKLSKGAIIAIVVVAVLILAAIGFAAEKIFQYQRAVEAVESIEIPEVPYLDIDSDFETYGESPSDDSEIYGIISGNEYTNSQADLKINTPSDDWKLLSKQEIYDYYSDIDASVNLDEDTLETYYSNSSVTLYYDMVMIDTVNYSNVQVMLLDKSGDESITLDDCFNSFKSELESNYENVTFEPAGIMTIGNNIYSVKKGTATVYGEGMVQYYAGANLGGRFVIMTATFAEENDVNFLEFFEQIIVQ